VSTCAIVCLDDVIFTRPSMMSLEGQRALYESLASNHRMVVFSAITQREAVKDWLLQQHYRYDLLCTREPTFALDDIAWKVQQVRDVRAMGWPVGLFLDGDPETVRRVFADGTTSLLLAHRLSRPNWLPTERSPKAWPDLVAFMEEQRRQAKDPEPDVPRPWDASVVP
jgi:hypothetical protein